jgi:hypothetical protein
MEKAKENEEENIVIPGGEEGGEEEEKKEDVLETLVNEINDEASGIKFFDTGFIIDDNFDSVYIVDGKIKFAPLNSKEYHDLDWALQRSNPMDLYNILLYIKLYLPAYKNAKVEDDRELLNKLFG